MFLLLIYGLYTMIINCLAIYEFIFTTASAKQPYKTEVIDFVFCIIFRFMAC